MRRGLFDAAKRRSRLQPDGNRPAEGGMVGGKLLMRQLARSSAAEWRQIPPVAGGYEAPSFLLYKDPDILVVEKPAGVASTPLEGSAKQTVTALLLPHFPELASLKDGGAVHRLDVETSGLLVVARNEQVYQKLREDFSKNRVRKEYEALVKGRITEKGRIDWPIGPDLKSSKKVRVYRNLAEARKHKAQEAVTHFAPQSPRALFPEGTWLHVTLKTGRRHQIRAHLAAIGHPIVGDLLYGGPPAERLFLHATSLAFNHPRTGEKLEFHSKARACSSFSIVL